MDGQELALRAGQCQALAMARFTIATAKQMSARGNAVRWSRHRMAKAAAANLPATPVTVPELDYAACRLKRVREQLDRIDGMIANETAPQALERLARTLRELSDQEFALSGRPKPGNRRPGPDTRQAVWHPGPAIPLDSAPNPPIMVLAEPLPPADPDRRPQPALPDDAPEELGEPLLFEPPEDYWR